MTERRKQQEPHAKERRREPYDYQTERERFEMFRARVGLAVSVVVLVAVTVAVIVSDIGDSTIVVALVGAAGAFLLGSPFAMTIDAFRRRDNE